MDTVVYLTIVNGLISNSFIHVYMHRQRRNQIKLWMEEKVMDPSAGSCFRQVTCFFRNIFTDNVFAGKRIIPDTKHYCKKGSLFIYTVRFWLCVNQFQTHHIFI
jgi:hypothetical protein